MPRLAASFTTPGKEERTKGVSLATQASFAATSVVVELYTPTDVIVLPLIAPAALLLFMPCHPGVPSVTPRQEQGGASRRPVAVLNNPDATPDGRVPY
ncbi:hypothetical protein E2C01_051644 [Portunus trituberculatus]|uniref:Uncharacterized protein n=1 Tax=Portunus trituberculatus TaxID=210409 RepID=A0A5B7GJG3_PORTR|nr:hypothetical protein [Portunus trituberculatus]